MILKVQNFVPKVLRKSGNKLFQSCDQNNTSLFTTHVYINSNNDEIPNAPTQIESTCYVVSHAKTKSGRYKEDLTLLQMIQNVSEEWQYSVTVSNNRDTLDINNVILHDLVPRPFILF